MNGRRLVSIVTPCFNEEANVEVHFERVTRAIEPFREKYDFEHVYTDNQSQDRTFELLSGLAERHRNVRVIRFARNLGANRAIYFGLQHAAGDAVVLIQADLQDPPELIPTFIRSWEEGFDVAYGQITNRDEGPGMRLLRRIYYKLVASLSEVPIPQNAGEFRLASRRVIDALMEFHDDDPYVRGMIAAVGYRQKAIPYERQARTRGRSSNNIPGLVAYAINGITSTTVVPLRLVILLGMAFSVMGFLTTIGLVLGKLLWPNSAPHGITTIASLITLFSGVQMLTVGILAEYIRKIYVQSLRRPRGFIQDRVNLGREPAALERSSTNR